MAKAYWVNAYRVINDADKLAAYAKLAAPAIEQAHGKFLARNLAFEAHEAGIKQRTTIVEFESVAAATAARQSPAYQEALAALGDGVERDFRIVEGV